jgi:hypothetical protein
MATLEAPILLSFLGAGTITSIRVIDSSAIIVNKNREPVNYNPDVKHKYEW